MAATHLTSQGSFAIASGRICDIHGLRTSAIASTAWAAIWLAASAFMPNIASLSIARALSGIGYAVACPAITGIIGSAFPAGRLRQVAFAALSGAAALGGGAAWIFAGLFANVKYFAKEKTHPLTAGGTGESIWECVRYYS